MFSNLRKRILALTDPSPSPSPFQCLPEHVAEIIAHYYCDLPKRHSMFFRPKKGINKPWFVLRDVSSSWMALAFKHIYKEARLVLSSDTSENALVFTYLRYTTKGRAQLYPYAKEVYITLEDIFDHSDQNQVDALTTSWPAEYVFPQALILIFSVDHDTPRSNMNSSAAEDTHYQWLAQRIRTSFPKLRGLKVYSNRSDSLIIKPESIKSTEWNMGLFLAAFYREVRDKKDMSQSSILTNGNLLRQNVPQFTSITHFGECIDSEIAQYFIKQSAATLESLEIHNRKLRFMEGCIYRDDGRLMTYPRLKKLEIIVSIENRESPIEVRGTELGALFPALQYLKLHPSRIFNDYALFKSCSSTLIGLDLELDSGIVDMLHRSNPFWSGMDSQLSHISFRPAYGSRPSMSADDFVRFVFGLCTPATRALSILIDIPYPSIVVIIPEYPHAESLQIFDIQECELSMLQMLSIIQLFPGLTDFSCGFAGIDMQLGQWEGLALPDYFRKRCYPLSRQLKCWHVYPVAPPPTGAIALVAITLATVCPKFACVHLQGGDIAYMFRELSTGLDNGIYREHQETVKKLFYF